jgi:protein-tyrosine phosphatase
VGFIVNAKHPLQKHKMMGCDLLDTLRYLRHHRCRHPNLPRIHSVGFLCYGNICRSPFCENYARQRFKDLNYAVDSASCGFHPESGRPSPKPAQLAARDFGVDLSEHLSQPINLSIVKSCSIIIGMHYSHFRKFREQYPEDSHKFFLLKHLAWPIYRLMNIPDPYGKSLSAFHQCYAEIKTCIDCWINAYGTQFPCNA